MVTNFVLIFKYKIDLFPQIFFVKDLRRWKQKVPQTIFRNDSGNKKAGNFSEKKTRKFYSQAVFAKCDIITDAEKDPNILVKAIFFSFYLLDFSNGAGLTVMSISRKNFAGYPWYPRICSKF